MNIHELSRSIQAGTLESLVKDAKQHEDESRKIEVKSDTNKNDEKVSKTEQKEPKSDEKEPKSEITEVELRSKFVELSKKGKRDELKTLLSDMGVEKVSDLKPEQFGETMDKLEAM
jgi:hypothetical protein